jgi:hypothetical protein
MRTSNLYNKAGREGNFRHLTSCLKPALDYGFPCFNTVNIKLSRTGNDLLVNELHAMLDQPARSQVSSLRYFTLNERNIDILKIRLCHRWNKQKLPVTATKVLMELVPIPPACYFRQSPRKRQTEKGRWYR